MLLCGYVGVLVLMIEFVVLYMLLFMYFLCWLQWIEVKMGQVYMWLCVLNVYDVVLLFVEGGCDFVMGYYYLSYLVVFDLVCYDMLIFGSELISLFLVFGCVGWLCYMLLGVVDVCVLYLLYMLNVYFGWMIEVIIVNVLIWLFFDCVYEIDMVEGLKVMVFVGYGVVFLLYSVVDDVVVGGWLIWFDWLVCGVYLFMLMMEIWLYCDKFVLQGDELWQKLVCVLWDVVCDELCDIVGDMVD